MNFLNPIVLFGLAAAALPVVIHLISRRRTKTVLFPSIEFLETMKTDRMRRLRMKQLLVLLLRTLIVLLIVLAFARPAVNSMFRMNARTAAVIIIDNSAGMEFVHNGERLSQTAVRKAGEILGLLSDGDQAAILVTGDEPAMIGGTGLSSPQELREALDDIDTSWSGPDPNPVFERAMLLLGGARVTNRELYYITDGDTDAYPDSIVSGFADVRIYNVAVGPAEHDGAVLTRLDLVDRLVGPGVPVSFNVDGCAGAVPGVIDVELFVNGERKDRHQVEVTPHVPFTTRFSYLPERTGWYSVSARIADRRFEAAEMRRLVMRVPERTRVLIAGETPDDLFFPRQVLGFGTETPYFQSRTLLRTELAPADMGSADVIVLSGVTGLDDAVYHALVAAVTEKGCGLIIFTPDVMPDGLYNDGFFRSLFPAQADRRINLGDNTSGAFAVMNRFDMNHPIMRDITGGGEFTSPEVIAYHHIVPGSGIHVVARYSDDSMAIGECPAGNGNIVVFGMSASISDSDLPLTGVFVPLLIRSVQYLAGTELVGSHYDAGRSIDEVIRNSGAIASVSVRSDGSPIRQAAFNRRNSNVVVAGEYAGIPGFYTLQANGDDVSRYAVDIPVTEAEFQRADHARLESTFRGASWKTIANDDTVHDAVISDRYGTELFSALMIVALMLIAAEMAVSRHA